MSSRVYIALLVVARAANADPVEPRVLTAPTAWLPPANGVVATAGIDTRGDGSIGADLGIGDLAALELGVDSDARVDATALHLARAAFRIGAHQDAWFVGQPAVVLGVRETIDAGSHAIGEAYVVASRSLGPLRVHMGIDAIDVDTATRIRPLAGLEYTPPQFSKTTLMSDLAWQPRFDQQTSQLEWIAGLGVRYRAFAWGAIELDYRAREGDGLAGSTVLVRVVGHWPPKGCERQCGSP